MSNRHGNNPVKYYRRNLPHIHPASAIFFLTYRLYFSLPRQVLHQFAQKRESLEKRIKDNRIPVSRKEKLLFDYFVKLLANQDRSPQWLANKKAARIVIDSLLYFHGKSYELICTVVMPNHVHTLLRISETEFEENIGLEKIIARHKKYTALKINKLLGRSGQFWQHETYDHVVRNEKALYRIINYILQNPVKARLTDHWRKWPHHWVNPDYID